MVGLMGAVGLVGLIWEVDDGFDLCFLGRSV